MARNTFTDPATGETYAWQVNHNEEQDAGKERSITRTANTGNVGAVRQQGDDGSYLLRYSGTILHRTQLQAFWRWYVLCRTRTIYFTDFDDQTYEVQITAFSPQRHYTLRNPRDNTNVYWTYSITMEVYSFIEGDMADAGVTP